MKSESMVKVADIGAVENAYITLPAIQQLGAVIVGVLQDMLNLSVAKVCVLSLHV